MGMTVDIDIGGPRLDDLEDEDVVPVEDVEEVEAVEIVEDEPPRPQRAPPAAIKKPNPWVKRILVLVVVIVIILVGLWAFIYFGTRITDISVNLSEDPSNYPDSIKATALVGTSGSASVAGKGNLEVRYDEDLVYSSKININDDGTGDVDVPYNSFIEGNGNYYFQVIYEGKDSPPAIYEVDYIVESLNITTEVGIVNNNGQLNVTVFMQDKKGKNMGSVPKGAQITFDEISLIGDSPIVMDDGPEDVDESFLREVFSYDQSGNYTISVTVENTRVKSDSEYHEVTETRDIIYFNIIPRASAVYTYVGNPTLTSYTVEFDASSSFNDGTITLYKWDFNQDNDFDDADEQTTSPTVQKTFTRGLSPDVLLNVEGDVMIWDPFDQEYNIETGATEIHVNSP
jgi:hypothetical protein